MSTEKTTETVIPVGAVHGLVLVDAWNWKVVRRTESGWAFVGYHRTLGFALNALAQAEIAAGCVKVQAVADLQAAVEAAAAVVAVEVSQLERQLAGAIAEHAERTVANQERSAGHLARVRAERRAT